MSTTHAQATAAARPVTIKGRELRMSPLNDRDQAELDQWLQQRHIANARRSLRDSDATPAERDEILSIALRQSMSITLASQEGVTMLATPEGIARLVWQSCRREHPDLTFEELRSLAMSDEESLEAMQSFQKLNIKERAVRPPKGAADPRQRRRQQANRRRNA